MEKVKFKSLLALLLILTTATPSFAIWKVVTDPHCLKVVTTNLATQKAIEGQHNHRLDSIASKKKKLELYTVSMATIKELYKVTLENVKGFGTESKYYTEIGRCAYDIILDVPELVKTVNKAKFSNKLMCLNELGNLVVETQRLVGDFVNIVNNARIDKPETADRWTKAVEKHALAGWHIRAGQSLLEDITQKVYQNRNITIPRYILLAPSGEIVCPDLPRPNRYEALAAALASCLEDEGR